MTICTCVPTIGLTDRVCNLATFRNNLDHRGWCHLWMVIRNHSKAQDDGWNWPFVTMIDIKIVHRMINKSQDYVGVHQLLHILSTTHTQTTIVISHHMIAFCACRRNCLELVTCPVKTCSSDQTVTPLIRVWSDWKALEGQISYSGSNDYGYPNWQWRLYSLLHNWYVPSEDLTQWIDYLIEF